MVVQLGVQVLGVFLRNSVAVRIIVERGGEGGDERDVMRGSMGVQVLGVFLRDSVAVRIIVERGGEGGDGRDVSDVWIRVRGIR